MRPYLRLDLLGAQGGHAGLGDLVGDGEEVLEGLSAHLGGEKVDKIGLHKAEAETPR